MQKLINVLAVLSFGVSSAVVAGGVYVYTQSDQIKENVKNQITESIKEALGTSELGSALLGGASDDPVAADGALGVDAPVEIPVVPF